jgi:hypothetical protein
MDSVARNDISNPANGLVIYNTDVNKLNIYDASISSWRIIFSGNVGINNIFGTDDRIVIDSSDPANPLIDIALNYAGQTSINTLGTVTTGTWNASIVQEQFGGTGYDNTFTNGQLLIGDATGGLTRNTLTGTENQVIVTNGDGTITLSTPQDIHTGANPEFVGLYLTDNVPLVLEGLTDNEFETSITLVDPTQDNTISFPDRSGTVVLSGAGTLTSDLAVHTDGNGQLVTAINGQDFNVNSDVINLGNAATDQITAAGNINAQNGLDVTGSDLTVGATNFTVAVGSGNTEIAGTLEVDGSTTLNGNTSITGTSTLTTGSGQVTFGGNVDAQSGVDVTGDVNITEDLYVTGNADINGSVNLASAGVPTTVEGTLQVDETANFDGATTFTDAVTLGDEELDVISINGTLQEGTLIAGQSGLVFDGSTADATNRTTFNITEPSQANTINFPDRSGTVVLSGSGTTFQNNLAVSTDDNGQLVNAVNDQPFNVNSDVINLGNTVTDQIAVAGDMEVAGFATTAGLTNTGDISTETLQTSDLATLSSAAITNNATVGGTLGVTGVTSTNGIVNTGAISTTTTLNTGGLATLESASVTNNATVGGSTTLTGGLTIGDNANDIVFTGSTNDVTLQVSDQGTNATTLVVRDFTTASEDIAMLSDIIAADEVNMTTDNTVAVYDQASGNLVDGSITDDGTDVQVNSGVNFQVNDGSSDVFTVSGASGNTSISGTLGVTGATTLSTLSASGDVNINNSTTSITNIGTGTSTGTITVGASSSPQIVNVGTGTGANDVNIATGGTGDVTISNASGGGVRIGNSRFIVNKPTPPIFGINNNHNATVSQVLDAGIFIFDAPVSRELRLPSAADLIAGLPGSVSTGDTFTILVYDIDGEMITLIGGSGITVIGKAEVYEPRTFYFRVSGTNTIDVY